jgi:hypothetical protein
VISDRDNCQGQIDENVAGPPAELPQVDLFLYSRATSSVSPIRAAATPRPAVQAQTAHVVTENQPSDIAQT